MKSGVIHVSSSHLGITHVGLLLWNNNEPFVFHNNDRGTNKYGGGIRIESLKAFMQGRKFYKLEPIEKKAVTWEKALAYVEQNKSRQYHPVWYNCEHFISELLKGEKNSPQLNRVGGSIALITLAIVLYRNKSTF